MQSPAPGLQRLGRLDVLLVRHARSTPPETSAQAGTSEADQPLTEEGRAAAERLADQLDGFSLDAVYSSPYQRAVETVQPAADRRELHVQRIDDLRERLLSPEPLPDWRDHLARAWQDPEYACPGGETGRTAQRRAVAVLDLLRVRHPDGGRLLVGSHGNLIGLILQAFEPSIDFGFWDAMPTPAVYWLEHDGTTWRLLGGDGVDRLEAS
jgi:2,3-bisphosphoglycerate-dependent phosphoglycerate mutase